MFKKMKSFIFNTEDRQTERKQEWREKRRKKVERDGGRERGMVSCYSGLCIESSRKIREEAGRPDEDAGISV